MILFSEILLGMEKLDNESSGALNFLCHYARCLGHCSTNSVFCLALLTLLTCANASGGRRPARTQRQGCRANDIPTICQAQAGRAEAEARQFVIVIIREGGPSSGWLWMLGAAFLSFFLEERVPDRVDGCIMYCLFSAFICGIDQSASPRPHAPAVH